MAGFTIEPSWLLLGAGALFFIYLMKPEWFRRSKGYQFERGYYVDSVYRHIDVIFPPLVELPDRSKGMFKGFQKEAVGEGWVLLTDEYEVHGLKSLDPGVNIDYGDPKAVGCGAGKWYCNIDKAGVEHRGFMGIGLPQNNSMWEEIERLRKELADANVRMDETITQRDKKVVKESEIAEKLGKRRPILDETPEDILQRDDFVKP